MRRVGDGHPESGDECVRRYVGAVDSDGPRGEWCEPDRYDVVVVGVVLVVVVVVVIDTILLFSFFFFFFCCCCICGME